MVVMDSSATIADEEERVESPPSPKVAFSIDLIEPEEIQFRRANSAVPPSLHTPRSMVAIRDYGDENKHPTIIFPPINHENLQISKDTPRVNGESSITSSSYNDEYSESDSYSYSDSDSNSSATFSPSDSSAASASPSSRSTKVRSAGDISLWFDSWVEILRSKANNSICRCSFRWVNGVGAVVVDGRVERECRDGGDEFGRIVERDRSCLGLLTTQPANNLAGETNGIVVVETGED